ncbi:helix-hairpin-helix domain-containing protein [Rhodoferax sp.]|uniref:ComEA family DNA-binding protein n=1 Tax=Rhodoferax sp. TaxID=50421 RepID=UPI0025D80240|nr:helix-hairpin-helix domain-containing protein [Rhodoferax sp.]
MSVALCVGTAWAGVDVNRADVAALDGIRGIGPSMSRKILLEREQGKFKNWTDFMARVPGVKDKTAAKFSAQGLTVDDQEFPEIPQSHHN